MLVSDILDSVRARLRQRGETGNFDSGALVAYLNDGLLDVCDKVQFNRVKVSAPLDEDGRWYIPSDLLRIEQVQFNGTLIEPLTPMGGLGFSGINSTLNMALGYQVYNGYLQFRPGSSSPLDIQYIARIAHADNEDQSIDLREEYRMACVYYILIQCCVELGQMDKAQYYEAKYDQEIEARRRTIRESAWKLKSSPSIPGVES